MTYFLSTRCWATGGPCRDAAVFFDSTGGQLALKTADDFARAVRGRHVVLATHGFNVSQSNGIDALNRWEGLYTLPSDAVYIGVLWPGDALLLRVIDYPVEAGEANRSGELLAQYLETYGRAASVYSFISHSLGARVMLQTVAQLTSIQPRNLILMAGAIEDSCLEDEFSQATARADRINVVASEEDDVLKLAYPAGNFVSGILRAQLPNLHTALGRDGPAQPAPVNAQGRTWQVPNPWNLGHLDYLPSAAPQFAATPPPMTKPGPLAPPPGTVVGWRTAWTAAVASTILNCP